MTKSHSTRMTLKRQMKLLQLKKKKFSVSLNLRTKMTISHHTRQSLENMELAKSELENRFHFLKVFTPLHTQPNYEMTFFLIASQKLNSIQ
jgi:hypothetical protein